MNLFLPTPVSGVISLLTASGFEAYAVGGCVRDSLLGKLPHDWDVTTNALPREMQVVFSGFRLIETGLRHGTLTVLWDSEPLEITTFRTDGTYSDGRHPDSVTFSRRLCDDLSRRDFTINAMAYSPRSGLVDCFDGERDLQRHLIRCVGDPVKRFQEDALRILRAVRFAAQLGFTIDASTAEALYACADRLTFVSAERKAAELQKLLCGQYVSAVLAQYTPLLSRLLPIAADAPSLAAHLPPSLSLRLAALLHPLPPEEATSYLSALRFDRATCQTVGKLLTAVSEPLPQTLSALRRAMGQWGTLWEDILTFRAAKGDTVDVLFRETAVIRKRGDCLTVRDLAVNGRDLTALGYRGAFVGEMLTRLLHEVTEERLKNNRTELFHFLADCKMKLQ